LYLWAFHPLSDVCFANIHSQLLCCLCIESMVSLTGQKRLHLRWSRLFQMQTLDRKSTRLNSSHANISYAVFCLKKKNKTIILLYMTGQFMKLSNRPDIIRRAHV